MDGGHYLNMFKLIGNKGILNKNKMMKHNDVSLKLLLSTANMENDLTYIGIGIEKRLTLIMVILL